MAAAVTEIGIGDMVKIDGVPRKAFVLDVGWRCGLPVVFVMFTGTGRKAWYVTTDIVAVEPCSR